MVYGDFIIDRNMHALSYKSYFELSTIKVRFRKYLVQLFSKYLFKKISLATLFQVIDYEVS